MRILYIDIDSLNPHHLGCYGYGRPTSPTIDRIAAEGVRFDRAYCSDSPCGPSRAAIFSGLYGVANGVVTHMGRGSQLRDRGAFAHGREAARRHPFLVEQLHLHGLKPVSFSSFASRHRFWWFTGGWAEFHNHLPGKNGNERGDEINRDLLPWLEAHATEDWFLHIHYWDPHRNYRCPQEDIDRMAALPPPAWPDAAAIAAQQSLTGPFTPGGLYPWSRTPQMPATLASRADFNRFVSGYDASIRYCDDRIAEVIAVLKRTGVWRDTHVILTSDHGEHMGGQGIYGDHPSAYEEGQRVPLIIRPAQGEGGVSRGSASPALVVGLDLAPTICALADIPIPEGWHGQSLLPFVENPQTPGCDHLVLTHGLYSAQRAVVESEWKLLRTYHPGHYPFPPLALYHLPSDPHEERDRSAEEPARVAAMDALLDAFLDRYGVDPDPLDWIIEDGPWKHLPRDAWPQPADRIAPVEAYIPS